MSTNHALKNLREKGFHKYDSERENRRWSKFIYKSLTKNCLRDELAHSMMDGRMYSRFHADEDGESWVRYGFLDEDESYEARLLWEGETEDERLRNWFEDNMMVYIRSDWDCTGKAFTRFIEWHVNPNGRVSYAHYMALDI